VPGKNKDLALAFTQAAPPLCAGALGFRELKLTGFGDSQTLGLTGFGGSAPLVLQLVRQGFPSNRVYVFARRPKSRDFALGLGAGWAGVAADRAPEPGGRHHPTTPRLAARVGHSVQTRATDWAFGKVTGQA